MGSAPPWRKCSMTMYLRRTVWPPRRRPRSENLARLASHRPFLANPRVRPGRAMRSRRPCYGWAVWYSAAGPASRMTRPVACEHGHAGQRDGAGSVDSRAGLDNGGHERVSALGNLPGATEAPACEPAHELLFPPNGLDLGCAAGAATRRPPERQRSAPPSETDRRNGGGVRASARTLGIPGSPPCGSPANPTRPGADIAQASPDNASIRVVGSPGFAK